LSLVDASMIVAHQRCGAEAPPAFAGNGGGRRAAAGSERRIRLASRIQRVGGSLLASKTVPLVGPVRRAQPAHCQQRSTPRSKHEPVDMAR
jgi:hypothetical protein